MVCYTNVFVYAFQDVAGGGKPSFLITNYALTMMMLFYLMYRDDPIVPSLSFLRHQRATYTPVFIGPWDVAFSNHVREWYSKVHNVNIMDLVSEFFSFYGELEASQWVINPLTGVLLAKEDVRTKSENLPECFNTYLQQEDELQLDTELCVQDPFEHTHNCTRGLHKSSFLEFQKKCVIAASISKNILKGDQTLDALFQPIELPLDMISDICEGTSHVKEDGEIITLDDSDTSQDIEVLDIQERIAQDDKVLSNDEGTPDIEVLSTSEKTSDVEILSDQPEVEILAGPQEIAQFSKNHRRSNEEFEFSKEGNYQNKTQSDSSVEVLKDCEIKNEVRTDLSSIIDEGSDVPHMERENSSTLYTVMLSNLGNCSEFLLDYSQAPEFIVTLDGNVHGKGNKLVEDYDTGQAACLLIQFALQQCLKIELATVENCLTDGKRKFLMQSDETNTEKYKERNNGDNISFPKKYLRLTKHMCVASLALWNGRKKISKTVAKRFDKTPLQYELAVTEAQLGECFDLPSSAALKFTIEVWQEMDNPKIIHVTGNSLSDTKTTQSQMIPMFSYLSSLCQNLLRRLTHYVNTSMY